MYSFFLFSHIYFSQLGLKLKTMDEATQLTKISTTWLINLLSRIWKRYKILQAFSLEIVFLRLASLSLSKARTITSGDQIAWQRRRRWLLFQWCNDGIIPEALWRVKWRITKPTAKPIVLCFFFQLSFLENIESVKVKAGVRLMDSSWTSVFHRFESFWSFLRVLVGWDEDSGKGLRWITLLEGEWGNSQSERHENVRSYNLLKLP